MIFPPHLDNHNRLASLDLLRFALAVYLIFYHTARYYEQISNHSYIYATLSLGTYATSCFFVLSGFMLTYVYLVGRERLGKDEQQKFLVARFSVIYPLHVVTLIISLLISTLNMLWVGEFTVKIEPGGGYKSLELSEIMLNVISHLTLAQAWNPFYQIFNVPSWSISALFFFYIVFAILGSRIFNIASPKKWLVIIGIAFAFPAIIINLFHIDNDVVFGFMHRNPLVRLPLFLAGILLCAIYVRAEPSSSRLFSWTGTMIKTFIFFVLLVGCYTELYGSNEQKYLIKNGLYYPAAISVVWVFVRSKAITSLCGKLIERVGKASLSIFFLHMPVYEILYKIEKTLGGVISAILLKDEPVGLVEHIKLYDNNIIFYPLYVVLIVVLSVLTQERFVSPLHLFIKKLYSSKDAVFFNKIKC